ncbi:MAG: hypothetical protein K6T63_13870 [Alicyclobacillus herbarius]|uniref:ComF family protein n=1 Tax=Alicyclobacillus herbarius TaxID=122960 RepID=UPI002357C87C|nr:hypothetical protein [Alicyclobacillus herbarius]MCL6633706.1 hypothetical protein [Alicyclobacillus herbarius]
MKTAAFSTTDWLARLGAGADARLTLRFRLNRLFQDACAWLYPQSDPICPLCHRPLPASPESDFPHFCLFCAQQLADVSSSLWTGYLHIRRLRVPVACGTVYEAAIPALIRAWKYDGVLALTPWLAGFVEQAVQRIVSPVDRGKWRIVPVPTSPDRMKKRGYHHVLMLAEQVAERTGIGLWPGLMRYPDTAAGGTQSQTAKSAALRAASVAGQFGVRSDRLFDPTIRGRIGDVHLLVVDDIVTTGSTLAACVDALYQAGATHVAGAAIARVR